MQMTGLRAARVVTAVVAIVGLAPTSAGAQRTAPANLTVAIANGAVTVSWTGMRDFQ